MKLFDAEDDCAIPPGIDEPLAMSRSAQVYYYSTDGLGSAGIVSDAAGVVKNKYSYDAWGAIKSQTAAISNPFGYTSREFAEVGTWFYRNRYMLPAIGRFINEDPLRYKAWYNFYSYVANDRTNFIDPKGCQRSFKSDPPSLSGIDPPG
ncbi:MAG TPA: RHS repeat-associated core domain-containing protein [Acidobacteriota bacterium]|nr:RHS repeat-associated core domain-containing protein [Acidobacteriota bacterium]